MPLGTVVRSTPLMPASASTTRRRPWLCSLALGISALCAHAAWGADAAGSKGAVDSSTGPTLEDLLQRIDGLERRNKALEGQVTELKALEGEKWLSQERADQIRSIVADVISDSEQRASLRQDAMTAGWNDGFFLASPDGRFKLQVSGLIQPRFMWSHIRNNYFQGYDLNTGEQLWSTPFVVPDTIEDRYGFDSNYNELCFKGHIFSPAVEFMVRTNVSLNTSSMVGQPTNNYTSVPNLGSGSGSLYLLDAWARIAFSDNWSMRFGQYRSPYAREQLITEANQMAVNRSTVVRNFGLWYTQGIEFQYQGDDFRWNLSVDDGGSSLIAGEQLQLVGGQPLDAPWYSQQVSWSVTSRLEWKLYGAWQDFTKMTSAPGEQQGLLMGLAYHTQASRPYINNTVTQFPNTPTTIGNSENYWDAFTIDAQWNFGGASLFMAGFWNYVNSQATSTPTFGGAQLLGAQDQLGIVNAYGFVIQPAIYFLPKWEWFTRYEYGYIAINDAGVLQTQTVGGGQPSALQGFGWQRPYSVITTGVNWYIDGQDVKWTLDVGFATSDVGYSWMNLPAGWRISGTDQVVMRTQLQLQF